MQFALGIFRLLFLLKHLLEKWFHWPPLAFSDIAPLFIPFKNHYNNDALWLINNLELWCGRRRLWRMMVFYCCSAAKEWWSVASAMSLVTTACCLHPRSSPPVGIVPAALCNGCALGVGMCRKRVQFNSSLVFLFSPFVTRSRGGFDKRLTNLGFRLPATPF